MVKCALFSLTVTPLLLKLVGQASFQGSVGDQSFFASFKWCLLTSMLITILYSSSQYVLGCSVLVKSCFVPSLFFIWCWPFFVGIVHKHEEGRANTRTFVNWRCVKRTKRSPLLFFFSIKLCEEFALNILNLLCLHTFIICSRFSVGDSPWMVIFF